MLSTLSLFRHLYVTLPPLFPEDTKQRMGECLARFQRDPDASVGEVEQIMVVFGYEVWPWSRAYHNFLDRIHGHAVDHFFLPKLAPSLADKCRSFIRCGGSFDDVRSGNAAEFFAEDERRELLGALINLHGAARQYASHQILGLDRRWYLERVREHLDRIAEMSEIVKNLRAEASREKSYPFLAAEMEDRARAFEHGLCHLGPEIDHDQMRRSLDIFRDYREHLQRMRGIVALAAN